MLRVEDLHFRYPGAPQPSLDGVSLHVPPGAGFGLLGPNGAGKTTLLALISGVLPVQRGRLLLGGRPIGEARAGSPRALAMVPQDYAFYPMLTVSENLRFFAMLQSLSGKALKNAFDSAIAFTQMGDFTNRRAEQLSGGLKRRLNLAIGLLTEPEILLLDEPTVGVDPQSRHFLLSAIGELQKAGRTIIYTSHYMDEIEAICSHVAILDQGRVLVAGPMGSVLDAVPPVLSLRLASPLPPDLLEDWSRRFAPEALPGHRYRLDSIRRDEIPALLADLQARGASPEAWSWGQQHLDDVFMHFTHRGLRDE